MRVIEQLISHLRESGHLTDPQLAQLQQMGLLRDGSNDAARRYGDYWGDEGTSRDPEPDDEPGGWDEHTDSLLKDVHTVRARQRRSRRHSRPLADSPVFAALERALADDGGFGATLLEIARRIEPTACAEPAARIVGRADPAELDAALSRDGLWARLWPHIEHEPIVGALDDRARRRFAGVVAARGRPNKSVSHGLLANSVVRRAVEAVAAHRALRGAFGRVARSIDPRRVFVELNLWDNQAAYEALVIVFSAGTRRTIAELPCLPDDVGLPPPIWLPWRQFSAGWAVAARIDPVAVLPYMQWCTQAWAAAPARISAPCDRLFIDGVGYSGRPIGQSDNWFGLVFRYSKWHGVRSVTPRGAAPGEPTQSITRDGVTYACCAPARKGPEPMRFVRTDSTQTVEVRWLQGTAGYRNLPLCRADYAALWAAGLHDLPLLTCPKQWEA